MVTQTGGTAMQGISAAIVYTAIDRISAMINDAEARMAGKVGPLIDDIINGIPREPKVAEARYRKAYDVADEALAGASIEGRAPKVNSPPQLIDQAVGTFFKNYTTVVSDLFPGLLEAGTTADDFIRVALASPIGVSYSELVDRAPADTAFAFARQDAWAQERQMLDDAAAVGHRFAPGATHAGIARMHAQAVRGAKDAVVAAHAARVQQERSDKMRIVRAELDQRMDRVKRLHQQTADAFRQKMQARGLWVSDQNAVIDSANNQYAVNAQFSARLDKMLQEAAARRFKSTADALEIADRDIDIARLNLLNGQELVDLLGNMVTTLSNQIRASGSYSGNERDATDWDAVLG
ncbi:MAG: hypothetical protein LBE61_09775 [Burkholderiaceae bacterium]|jgi:predicted RNA-binding protein YlxR (DUF448 family)|nr:hypothetical protein [Burkholderiaceae bacterium]